MRDKVMYMGEQFEVVATSVNDKGTTVVLERITPKPAKQDIRDYCREHRVWAAKDSIPYNTQYGQWAEYKEKPTKRSIQWHPQSLARGQLNRDLFLDESKFTFPDCPWDKSLIAPDGSMPLMEMKEAPKTIPFVAAGVARKDWPHA